MKTNYLQPIGVAIAYLATLVFTSMEMIMLIIGMTNGILREIGKKMKRFNNSNKDGKKYH